METKTGEGRGDCVDRERNGEKEAVATHEEEGKKEGERREGERRRGRGKGFQEQKERREEKGERESGCSVATEAHRANCSPYRYIIFILSAAKSRVIQVK
jgi:hypothetical protein